MLGGFLIQKCMQCGQLILTKISKIGASKCQTFRLKCIAFDFHWGSASDSSGELIALSDLLAAVFKELN